MNRTSRTIGVNGPDVCVVGFGGWGIGGETQGDTSYGETDDDLSKITIKHALAQGINFFDTSPAYGDGRSEAILGEVLEPVRSHVKIATKVGYTSWTARPDFSEAGINASLEQSRERLRTNFVDIVWLHSPEIDILLQNNEAFATLDKLRSEKKIGLWGVSCKSPQDGMKLLDKRPIDALMVNFNMLDPRCIDVGLFDRVQSLGTGIVARTPLCFGFLTGLLTEDTLFPRGDHRRAWPRQQIKTWVDGAREALKIANAAPGEQACAAALRYCLSFPAVSAVIPGALHPDEVNQQILAAQLGPLPQRVINQIIALDKDNKLFVERRQYDATRPTTIPK